MPPVTMPLKTYCAIGGIPARASGVDDRHGLGLALSHLLDAEGSREDVADGIEVARPRGAFVVDLLALAQELAAIREGVHDSARRVRDGSQVVFDHRPRHLALARREGQRH